MRQTPPSDALDPASWSGGVLPKETDDVFVTDAYFHNGPAGVVRMKSLSSDRGAGIFFARASLTVSGDVTLESSIEFQKAESALTVGGTLSVETGSLAFVGGLAGQKSGSVAPRFEGRTLNLSSEGQLRLRWFDGVPEGMPGNAVPYVQLSGDARFAAGSSVLVKFERTESPGALTPGEYLLLTAGGSIKGPLPLLEVEGLPPGAETKGELKLSPDRRKLLLVVTAVK
jgi:hypothetical protein